MSGGRLASLVANSDPHFRHYGLLATGLSLGFGATRIITVQSGRQYSLLSIKNDLVVIMDSVGCFVAEVP